MKQFHRFKTSDFNLEGKEYGTQEFEDSELKASLYEDPYHTQKEFSSSLRMTTAGYIQNQVDSVP